LQPYGITKPARTDLCSIPYAVNISVSRSWWLANYCSKHVELIL